MSAAQHIAHAASIPSYCQGSSPASRLTPARWAKCLQAGWDEPTTTWAHAGYTFGHTVLPVLIIVAVLAFIALRLGRRRSRRTPAQAPR